MRAKSKQFTNSSLFPSFFLPTFLTLLFFSPLLSDGRYTTQVTDLDLSAHMIAVYQKKSNCQTTILAHTYPTYNQMPPWPTHRPPPSEPPAFEDRGDLMRIYKEVPVMPEGMQSTSLPGSGMRPSRGERTTTSCGECRRRKQKVRCILCRLFPLPRLPTTLVLLSNGCPDVVPRPPNILSSICPKHTHIHTYTYVCKYHVCS